MLNIKKGIYKDEVRYEQEDLFLGSNYSLISQFEQGVFTIVHLSFNRTYEAIIGGQTTETGELLLVIDATTEKMLSSNECLLFRG